MKLYGNLSKGVTFIILTLFHVKRQLPQSVGQVVFNTSLNTEAHKIISPFPLQYQVDERYAPEYPPI